jgi:hypothetical protein
MEYLDIERKRIDPMATMRRLIRMRVEKTIGRAKEMRFYVHQCHHWSVVVE